MTANTSGTSWQSTPEQEEEYSYRARYEVSHLRLAVFKAVCTLHHTT